ncbi:MAG: amidase [Myxococcota bacterium]|nr:amidase [Myxococcota bacterium]
MSDDYQLDALSAPRTAGRLLKIAAALVETRWPGDWIANRFLNDVGIQRLRDIDCSDPLPAVHPIFGDAHNPSIDTTPLANTSTHNGDAHPGIGAADFRRAYLDGTTSPLKVAERIISTGVEPDLRPSLNAIVALDQDDLYHQARLSTQRYEQNRSLGPLDGVPIGVKDELDLAGYRTRVGTCFLGLKPALTDATPVARLRSAGALLIGKLNMHEIGIGVTGINPHHGTARNPYDRQRLTGGSSSGSGAAVAAGLCPIAVGADGGGSIRIPASFCGVVGLKPTYGRVSEMGAAPLCWSVAHVGPLGLNVSDVAAAYSVMSGPDPADINTMFQPEVEHNFAAPERLDGLKVGVYDPFFTDADPDVVNICQRALDKAVQLGAQRHTISISNLDVLRTAHMVTIVSEMLTSMGPHLKAHKRKFGYDVRLNLAIAQRIRNSDYVKAQRLRVGIYREFKKLYESVDIIAMPTTACTAPHLRADALETGDSDLALLDKVMRFSPIANLTGLPSISLPVGYDQQGLPVGLQLMGAPWTESKLLRIAGAIETHSERRLPKDYVDLISPRSGPR